jgi:hypothetical protein
MCRRRWAGRDFRRLGCVLVVLAGKGDEAASLGRVHRPVSTTGKS